MLIKEIASSFTTVRRYPARYVIMLLFGISGFFSLKLEELEFIRISLYPAPFIIVIYLGFHFGRLPGALSGLLTCLPVTLFAHLFFPLHQGATVDLWNMLLGRYVDLDFAQTRITGCALQDVAGLAMAGYLSGALREKLEEKLFIHGKTLADLFPVQICWYAGRAYGFLHRLMRAQAQTIEDDSKKSTLQERITSIFKKSLVLPLVGLVVVLGYTLVLRTDFLTLQLPPFGLPAVTLVLIALLTGPRLGILVTVIVTFIMTTGQQELQEMIAEDIRFSGGGIWTPLQVFGIAVACWWSGRLRWLLEDNDRLQLLSEAAAPLFGPPRKAETASYPHLLVIVLAAVTVSWAAAWPSPDSRFYLRLGGFPILYFVVVVMALSVDGRSLSNRLLLTLSLLSMVSLNYFVTDTFTIRTWQPDAVGILVLTLIPLAVERLRRDALWQLQLLLLGGLAAYILGELYLYWWTPTVALLDVSLSGYSSWLMELLLTVAAFYYASGPLWRRIGKG